MNRHMTRRSDPMKRTLLFLMLLGALFSPAQSRAGTGPPACTTIASGSVTRLDKIGPVTWKYGVSARSTAICNYNIEEIYVQVQWAVRASDGYGAGAKQDNCFTCSLWWVNSYGSFLSNSYYPCISVTARAIFIGGQGDDTDKSTVCAQ
jgi:hypothetical protein